MKLVIGGKEVEVDDQVISTALENKTELTIDTPELVIRTRTDEETFVRNVKEDAKTAGVEIAVKEARNTLGLDFQGKTVDNLIEAVRAKAIADANIEPDQKVKSLESDVATLRNNIATLTQEKQTVLEQFQGFKNEQVLNNTLLQAIPDATVLPKTDMLLIVKSKMGFKVDENGQAVVLDQSGEVKKDPITLSPLNVKSALDAFFAENGSYLKPAGGGAGGQDQPGGNGVMSVQEFIDMKAKEGVSHASAEFQNALNEAIAQKKVDPSK